jgi:hypothetical protein
MDVLAVKLFFAPIFIVITSFVQKKYGARIGGILLAIPFILTPILIVMYLQEGKDFFHHALIANYAGQIGLLFYILTYARLAGRFSWKVSALGATSAYLSSILILSSLLTNVWMGLALWTPIWVMLLKIYPAYDRTVVSHASPWWDILMRIGSALTLIFIITAFANDLGPRLAGALAMYPIMTTVTSTFNHSRFGSRSAIALLHGMTQFLFVTALFPIAAYLLFV